MAEIVVTLALRQLQNQLESGLDRAAGVNVIKIRSAIEEMRGFLNDADWRRNRDDEGEGSVEFWVERARGLAFRLEDVVDGYKTRTVILKPLLLFIIKMCFLLPLSFVAVGFPYTILLFLLPFIFTILSSMEDILTRWFFSARLKRIARDVDGVRKDMSRFGFEVIAVDEGERRSSASPFSFSLDDMVGMEADAEQVEAWLLDGEAQQAGEDATVIVIDGAMGVGKTTLAARTYEATKNHFDCHAWAFLSQPFNKKDALRGILKGFYESSSESSVIGVEEMDEEVLVEQIRSYLRDKRYMLVLDNVRDREMWSELSPALPPEGAAGKVLITTPDREVADGGSHVRTLTGLGGEDSMKLLIKRAFAHDSVTECPPELQGVADEILAKCQGLPISIVTVAGLLSIRDPSPEEWRKVVGQLHRYDPNETRTGQDVFVTSGYTDLSPELKRCFLYCSIFPDNYNIPWKKLVRLLVAEGFHDEIPGSTKEEVTERQLNRLIERNMLQVARRGLNGEVESCRILGLMRGFSLYMSKRGKFCKVDDKGMPDPEPFAWKELRRFSTYDTAIISSKDLQRSRNLRSLLLFASHNGSQGTPPRPLKLQPLKILRVLELRGLGIRGVPVAIAGLVLLHYLGLRGTKITKLPRSLHLLVELETLDIRQTKVRWLPDLYSLRKLRHLYMEGSFVDRVVTLSKGVIWLTELQTLAGAKATKSLSEELGCLAKLRKLSIGKTMTEDSSTLCTSINKMKLLNSLGIKCEWGERFDMGGLELTQRKHLNKLRLGGRMDGLLNWVIGLASLSYLYLWDSRLTEDPLHALQHLNKLVLLSLCNAYEGAHACCCGGDGFPNLKKLSIIHARELESLCFAEEGAMPRLETLFISYCPKLLGPPDGIENLKTLKLIQLSVMPSIVTDKANEMSNQETTTFKVRIIPQLLLSNKN